MALQNAFENLAVEAKQLDSGELEFTHYVTTVTASGDTTLITPAAGKKIRTRWLYAVNDPSATSPPLITFKLGSTEFFRVYALSKRHVKTGGTDEVLAVNLSATGSVAITVIYEEVT